MANSANDKLTRLEISCAFPFTLYVDGNYEVELPEGSVTVSLDRVRQDRFDPRLEIDSGQFDIMGDRCGFVSYTQCAVRVERPALEKLLQRLGQAKDIDSISAIAQVAINHVVDGYRHATGTPWIRRLTNADIYMLNGLLVHESGIVEGVKRFGPPSGAITLPVEGLSDDAKAAFVRRIASPEPPPVWDTLWLDSEDALDRGDCRSAVVWGHSAVETLSHALVVAWLRATSRNVDSAAELIGREKSEIGRLKRWLSLEELAESLNDTHKVQIALWNVIRADPGWGEPLRMRFESLASARNLVLHAGADVTEDHAEGHLDLVRQLMHVFSNECTLAQIRDSVPQSASIVLSSMAGRTLSADLAGLVDEIEEEGFQITVWSIRRQPSLSVRRDEGVGLTVDGQNIRVYLPKKKLLDKVDWQQALAEHLRVLTGYRR